MGVVLLFCFSYAYHCKKQNQMVIYNPIFDSCEKVKPRTQRKYAGCGVFFMEKYVAIFVDLL